MAFSDLDGSAQWRGSVLADDLACRVKLGLDRPRFNMPTILDIRLAER